MVQRREAQYRLITSIYWRCIKTIEVLRSNSPPLIASALLSECFSKTTHSAMQHAQCARNETEAVRPPFAANTHLHTQTRNIYIHSYFSGGRWLSRWATNQTLFVFVIYSCSIVMHRVIWCVRASTIQVRTRQHVRLIFVYTHTLDVSVRVASTRVRIITENGHATKFACPEC